MLRAKFKYSEEKLNWMSGFDQILKISKEEEATEIIQGILSGEKLTEKDASKLFKSDLHLITGFADYLREKQAGDYASFVINRQINYSNICISRCKFCAFYRKSGEEGAYTMSREEILNKASEAVAMDATELHIVGSHNPDIPFEYYEGTLRQIKKKFPDISIKGFTATEIHFFSNNFRMSTREVLERLKEAGLDFMPGGGAEILDDSIRKKLCPAKASSREWLDVMKTAHELGIKSNATMLFGHIEKPEQRVKHMFRLMKLQEKTGGFLSFIPLVYHPENNPLGREIGMKASGVDILKTIAISRIVLGESFTNIRAYWIMLGKKLAQVALRSGANDIDGTVLEEKVAHEAGASTSKSATVEELLAMIRKAGLKPVQRSTDYNIIRKW